MSTNSDISAELDQIHVRLVRLRATFSGLVTGLLLAFGIFAATNWLVLKGGERVGPHLSLLGQFFVGYSVTFVGSFIGAVYGFIVGFGVGYLGARLYNLLVQYREKR